MTDKFGLKQSVIEKIQSVFTSFGEIDSVVLYGSRAKGNYRNGSDIDLTIKTNPNAKPNSKLLYQVIGGLDSLDLVYSFDISIFPQIKNADLIDHINRVGITFYKKPIDTNAKQLEQQVSETPQAHYDVKHPSHRQSEQQLEDSLIKRLNRLGYDSVNISTADELRANLKAQLNIHNSDALKGKDLSDAEFTKVLNHLDKGNVFARAKTLRDRFQFTRDDGSSVYINFLNTQHWCQNQYQVTNQVTIVGKRENRYDVTLLVNGLPLMQIELKRRGVEIKEAFNQVNRYQRDTFWSENGLFQYVQLFVISNGVNTKYFANNAKKVSDFKQTFYWALEDNTLVTQLDAFADAFLEKCHLSKMICKYIVSHESSKLLMVLRPYQFYAVEAIVERVKETRKNGYIWHTTGSGKTLTSFKTAQILTALPTVHKVVFVVDRADLDYQTQKEFNFFHKGCVDETNNTKSLVKQMAGENPLIVTTIQKLNTAISKERHESAMEGLKDKRVVFIFDECHRSQFGETHKRIVDFFEQAQMFGFTGTPIFEPNSVSHEGKKRTTRDLFTKCLHKYLITHAIADDNVLKFSIEYWGKLKRKDGSMDEDVPAINTKEFFESDKRISDITDWVIANHGRKTHDKQFSAMMCVSSVDALQKYYKAFAEKKAAGEHDLRVMTIFTYNPNEADIEANGEVADENTDPQNRTLRHTSTKLSTSAQGATSEQCPEPVEGYGIKAKQSREFLEACVADYNAMYQTSESVKDSKGFYKYYKAIAQRMKDREKTEFKNNDRADILLVVNMFLTGFDAKKLNTIYVDKNLQYHGLIQAFSRTNRTMGELKSQGNVVCFRNLKKKTDEAITLFSDMDAKESIDEVLMEPYENYVARFNSGVAVLREIAENPDAVNALISEDDQVLFVKAFRYLMRTLNVLKSFTEFTWPTSTTLSTSDLEMSHQEFEDFKGKYLDIKDRADSENEGASIIDEIDFELELIHKDEINVTYILELLADLQRIRDEAKKQGADGAEDETSTDDADEAYERAKENILNLLGKETQLRSKRELIEQFINDYMPNLDEKTSVGDGFKQFWDEKKEAAIEALCAKQKMDKAAVMTIIDEYHFSGKEPMRDTVFAALAEKPKLLERKSIFEKFVAGLNAFIRTFEDNIG